MIHVFGLPESDVPLGDARLCTEPHFERCDCVYHVDPRQYLASPGQYLWLCARCGYDMGDALGLNSATRP